MNTETKSDVALREEAMQAFWEEHDVFKTSIETPAGSKPKGDFVFYDGPPFATGTPHYGHILASAIKDAIPRFWTMQGYRVRRKWGWDCHGLPLENLIEKKLGLATKRDIEEYGVQNFNEAARDAVLEYRDEWARIIPRMGRWADMVDDYKTMDSTYTESVWWVFSELNKKGLVFEGFKSMHLCPRCGTTLSNFEVNQGYKDIKDIAVTVKLPLVDEPETSLLVWTTTPWTLPGNMAAAVHNEHDYVKVRVTTDEGSEQVILAKARLVQLGTEDYEILAEMKGVELVGQRYTPPFTDYYPTDSDDLEKAGLINAWKIYHADYVELGDEGTGAVHLAPAFGEDDLNLAKENQIPIIHHVDEEGKFEDFIEHFGGQLVKPKDDDDAGVTHLDADIEIVKALKERGKLFKKENITHSYPHCWRCDTPLLNYATTSWFVDVPKIKDALVAENNKVNWVPDHVGESRFGKWLEGARDWAVSRQRYWGAPLPIWRHPETKEFQVFGSLAELQEHAHQSGNTYITMRHGQSESNANNVVQTEIDVANPLTETGKEQIAAAITKLKTKGITRIIASPFERTKATAELVREGLGLPTDAVTCDERLGEIQLGTMNGQDNSVYHNFIRQEGSWHDCAPEDGESWTAVRRRVGDFIYDTDMSFSGETILIISHNSPLRLLGTVHDGRPLGETDYDHDEEGRRYENAEIRDLPFTPMPHNDDYDLDFHRPYIDNFLVYAEDGTQLERVPDVFDCWFESGSMPYGQHHFLGDDEATFLKEYYPANFIAEGLDQTRGWFYSLIVLGTALFGKSPYQNVIVNGLVLAEDGKKMSKSLQNYPDPMDVADSAGADAMRFYLLSSPIVHGEDLNFSEKGVLELQRKNIGRLHNVLAMYEEYQSDVAASDDSKHVLDAWILARLAEANAAITSGYESYELDKATRPLTDLIDDLSVWYLRRSRDRLKGDDADDKEACLATLRYVLREAALLMAPVMPFYAEYLWQAVRSDADAISVHLAAWPQADKVNEGVLTEMAAAREVVTAALELRAKAGLKVRQPLTSVTGPELPANYQTIVADEVNVKQYEVGETVAIDTDITSELKAEGEARDLMRAIQDGRKKAGLEAGDQITLTLQTSHEGEALVDQFRDQISTTVGATAIVFDRTDGEDITIGEHSFTISIKKV